MVDSGAGTGSDLSIDRDSDLSSSSPTSFNSSGYQAFGMQQVATSTPIARQDEAGHRRLSANAMEFEPRTLPATESTETNAGPTDWFGLSAPKFGTLIPNRIFVGGISSTTTENDLCGIFSRFGRVLQAKIIMDRSGVSKGYGFITFETETEAKALCDRIAAKDMGPIMFRERRLTVAPAVKKQVTIPPAPTVEIAMHSAPQPPLGLAGNYGCFYYVPQPGFGFGHGHGQPQPQMQPQPGAIGGYFHGGAGDPAGLQLQHVDPYHHAQMQPTMPFYQPPVQTSGFPYGIPPTYVQSQFPPQSQNGGVGAGPFANYIYDGYPQQLTGQDWYNM